MAYKNEVSAFALGVEHGAEYTILGVDMMGKISIHILSLLCIGFESQLQNEKKR